MTTNRLEAFSDGVLAIITTLCSKFYFVVFLFNNKSDYSLLHCHYLGNP
jgi:hypothetical protein